jgi:hypothetical protein
MRARTIPARKRALPRMNTIRSLSFALLLAGLSIGCASPSSQRVPLPPQDVTVSNPSVARIYFVRLEGAELHLSNILVFDGEKEIGALTADTFLCWERPGGRTLGRAVYNSRDPSKGQLEGIIDLDCPAGSVYYYGVNLNREWGRPEVSLLDPAEGKSQVAKRKPAGS